MDVLQLLISLVILKNFCSCFVGKIFKIPIDYLNHFNQQLWTNVVKTCNTPCIFVVRFQDTVNHKRKKQETSFYSRRNACELLTVASY